MYRSRPTNKEIKPSKHDSVVSNFSYQAHFTQNFIASIAEIEHSFSVGSATSEKNYTVIKRVLLDQYSCCRSANDLNENSSF